VLVAFTAYLVAAPLTHHSRTNPSTLLDDAGWRCGDQGVPGARTAWRPGWMAGGLGYAWIVARARDGVDAAGSPGMGRGAGDRCYLLISFPPR
jgi:hypothetical protein